MTNAKDEQRLQLLKEVAGTKVYEEHREQSLKIMEETNQKRVKIDELLTSIEEKIDTLSTEKRELLEFQTLDKDRRCVEYNLYKRESNDAAAALASLEETYKTELESSNSARKDCLKRQSEIMSVEKELKEATTELEMIDNEMLYLTKSKNDDLQLKTRLEIDLKESEAQSEKNVALEHSLNEELLQLNARLAAVESILAELENERKEIVELEDVQTVKQVSFHPCLFLSHSHLDPLACPPATYSLTVLYYL